jgi:hypothetical protein
MPSTDRKLELKAKTSVAQTGSQPFVYAKGLKSLTVLLALSDTDLFRRLFHEVVPNFVSVNP